VRGKGPRPDAPEAKDILRRLIAKPSALTKLVEDEKAIADAKSLLAKA
jgi:hypothetical protein